MFGCQYRLQSNRLQLPGATSRSQSRARCPGGRNCFGVASVVMTTVSRFCALVFVVAVCTRISAQGNTLLYTSHHILVAKRHKHVVVSVVAEVPVRSERSPDGIVVAVLSPCHWKTFCESIS